MSEKRKTVGIWKMHKAAGLFFVLIIAAGVAACGGGGTPSRNGEGKIRLGFTAGLSGAFAEYGQEERRGTELAVAEINAAGGINGSKVEVTYSNDRNKPENAIVIARRYCNSDIPVVLGFSSSTIATAAMPTYEQCRLPLIASATTSARFTGKTPYHFRTVLSDAITSAVGAEYAVKRLGHKRLAVLYQKDVYGEDGRANFVKNAKRLGAKIVYDQGYQLGETAFRPQLAKIKKTNPDLLFLASFYPEAAHIAQQLEQSGMKVPTLSLDGVLSPKLLKQAGSAAEGMLILGYFDPSGSGSSVAREFADSYRERFGRRPSNWAALAYDAVYAVKHAAKAAGGTDRAGIKKGLLKVDFEGATGNVSFDRFGDRVGEVVVFVVKDGKVVPAEKQPADKQE